MGRILIDYATPWRLLMVLLVAIGLLAAAVVDRLAVQIGGVAIAALALFTLLAQLDRRIGSGGVARQAKGGPSSDLAPGSKSIAEESGPIVTVIIPGRNEARYARDCVASLKAQTLANFEAIIIDDGSTDATLDVVLKAIAADPRFRIYRMSHSIGPALARNRGVALATTRYVTFLDLDDFLAPDSLAARVEVAEEHAETPWVAGSYCWHDNVDPSTTPETWVPSTSRRRATISWMGNHDDNVVVVSAPLLRRDAFLAVGGFDDAPTAEDPIFWFKLLRWGFTLVGAGLVGVAYRLKPTSRAVSTALEIRDTIAGLIAERGEPRAPIPGQAGPFFFTDGINNYRSALAFTRRSAVALGIAVADGTSEPIVTGLVDDLRGLPHPLVGWEVAIADLARGSARRVFRARGEVVDEAVLARDLDQVLAPVVGHAQSEAGRWQGDRELSALRVSNVIARSVTPHKLLPVTPHSLGALLPAGRPFLLLPSAAYHTDELIELVEELRHRRFSPVAMVNDRRWATTGPALARVDVPAVQALPAGEWLDAFAGILTFNDWGEYFADYVKYVTGRPAVSFAKVEGVQDWHDADTGMTRQAYMAADVVLCQGGNDAEALKDRRDHLEVVGSSRLETIWNDPVPADAPPRVVGNVNFTYGVQSEHRDLWVESLREACGRAGVPLDLSVHPSESARYPGLAATDPIRHLLVQDSILVSRFSTVLFEGMARGCSVIYYNPHGEKVPTFQHPEGAFDVAEDLDTLATIIAASTARRRAEARTRAAGFFLRQVSVTPGASAASRTESAIERHLTP